MSVTDRAGWVAGVRRTAALLALTLAGCGSGDVRLFAGPDDTPQTIVLTATADGATVASLAWTSAGDNRLYRVDRNGTQVASTEGLAWTDRALAAGQRYCWRVVARSGFGWQARSNEACLGTAAGTTDWRIERVGSGRWPALAIDPSDNPHLCWTGAAGTGIQWLQVGPGRSAVTIDDDGQGQCSIAIAADGTVHVAYLSRFGLRHAVRDGTSWRTVTVDAEARAGNQRFDGPALALAADGTPRIAYRRLAGTSQPGIALATSVRGGWSFDVTAIRGLVGARSLAIDAAGTSWLATTDDLGQDATVWRRTAAGWVESTRHSLAPTRGDGPPVALDTAGRARMAWWQRDAPTTSTLVTLRWNEVADGRWRSETIVGGVGLGTRVAIGASGDEPRVAVVDDTGTVRTYLRSGGAWRGEALPGQGGVATTLDFATDGAGQLRLAYDRLDEGGSVVLASRVP